MLAACRIVVPLLPRGRLLPLPLTKLLYGQQFPLLYPHLPRPPEGQVEAIQILGMVRVRCDRKTCAHPTSQPIKGGHRLLEVIRRLTSSIEVRRPIAEYRERTDEFLLVDQSGYVYREQAVIPKAVASYRDPLKACRLQEDFLEMWEHSEPDPEIRRLYL